MSLYIGLFFVESQIQGERYRDVKKIFCNAARKWMINFIIATMHQSTKKPPPTL